jgi:hypothetical protein
VSVLVRYHAYLSGAEPPTVAALVDRSRLPDSGPNRLRAEHCPALLDAARIGLLLRAAASHSFSADGDHDVWVHPMEAPDGGREEAIFDPCLVGSNEAEAGYYKIATGLCVDVGDVGWLVTPPLDPRVTLPGWHSSWGYLRPGFQGPLFAVLRPTGDARLAAGAVIGQLVPLAAGEVRVVEAAFGHQSAWQPDHHFIDPSRAPLRLRQRELEERLRSGGVAGVAAIVRSHAASR